MLNLVSLTVSDISISQRRVDNLHGKPWSHGADLKREFRKVALQRQQYQCCYCGYEISEDQRNLPDIEHFADKGEHPEWSFELCNLLLACKYCNQHLKRDYETVLTKGSDYRSTRFVLVHPYLDDVGDHLEGGFVNGLPGGDVQLPLAKTLKGLLAILLFQLDNPAALGEWERILQERRSKAAMSTTQQDRFDRATLEVDGY